MKLKAKTREEKPEALRNKGILPAVLYGEGIKKAVSVSVNKDEFEKVFEEAGETSIVSLELGEKKYDVLIHDTAKHPLTEDILHVDFFHPSTKKEVTAEVPLIFIGEENKELEGNISKEAHELEVKGLAHKLPKEIQVDISKLKNVDDRILVKDLDIPEGITVQKDMEDIIVIVTALREEEKEEAPPVPEEEGEEKEEEKEEEEKQEE